MRQGEVQSPDLGSEKNNKMNKKTSIFCLQNDSLSKADIYQQNLMKICSKLNYKEVSGSIKGFETENG